MTLFKNKYRTQSIRLLSWDYSNPWWYFVTINSKHNKKSLGFINNEVIKLTEVGKIVDECWQNIPKHFPNVELDYFIIMPNHIHGIIILNEVNHGDDNCRDVVYNVSTVNNDSINFYSTISPKRNSLSVVIRSFKSAVSKILHERNIFHFSWQSGYYDRIIRNEKELLRIRTYIQQNPTKWNIKKNY